MDRLICGDVGFGKTEVALRAAFVVAMTGKQVAVVVPTTLLARQHYRTFTERFEGLPVNVAQASRLVPAKELDADQEGHRRRRRSTSSSAPTRCSARRSSSRDLGLLIVDEEQHFGVTHKERLKAAARRRARADADGDADPAHAAAGADRRARAVDHRHAAGRPARGAHLRHAVRSAGDPRGAAARALSRRPGFYVVPRIDDLAERQGLPRQERAGGEGRGRARPDAADRDRGHDDAPSTTANTTSCSRPRSSNPASTSPTPTR